MPRAGVLRGSAHGVPSLVWRWSSSGTYSHLVFFCESVVLETETMRSLFLPNVASWYLSSFGLITEQFLLK